MTTPDATSLELGDAFAQLCMSWMTSPMARGVDVEIHKSVTEPSE
jgi:hypothetical protein